VINQTGLDGNHSSASRDANELKVALPYTRQFLFVILVVYLALSYSAHWQRCRSLAELELARNQSVLQHVPTYYLNQMYFIAPILDAGWKELSRVPAFAGKSIAVFGLTYWLWYTVGALMFLTVSYKTCLRITGNSFAVLSCFLYLIALFPLFWCDNVFHPSDPFGCLLAALIISRLLDDRCDLTYYLLLLVSGFVWEKHVFIPLIVAINDYSRNKPFRLTAGRAFFGVACAGFGQALVRWLNPGPKIWSGNTLAQNMHMVPRFLLLVAMLYGVQILASRKPDASTPRILQVMTLYWLAWPIIYLGVGGVLGEMRGTMIMVPLSWPLLAIVWSRGGDHSGRQSVPIRVSSTAHGNDIPSEAGAIGTQ
jgi:hypothetical protein